MKQVVFLFFISLIVLGWVGCESKINSQDPYNVSIYIDSTLTACGMDSFLIKSPWMQDYINDFIDTVQTNHLGTCILIIAHVVDNDGNDYFLDRASSSRGIGRLFDCEGNLLVEKAPWSTTLEGIEVKKANPTVVEIVTFPEGYHI